MSDIGIQAFFLALQDVILLSGFAAVSLLLWRIYDAIENDTETKRHLSREIAENTRKITSRWTND